MAAVPPPPAPPSPAALPAPHRASGRAAAFHEIVDKAARRYNLQPGLIHAVIFAESSYRADAVSAKGAVGLMQLMPATAQSYGVTDPRDPVQNIYAGSRHLRLLLEQFDHDLPVALAAYNAGAGAVMRHGGIPPYPETIRYVERVLERYGEPRTRSSGQPAARMH